MGATRKCMSNCTAIRRTWNYALKAEEDSGPEFAEPSVLSVNKAKEEGWCILHALAALFKGKAIATSEVFGAVTFINPFSLLRVISRDFNGVKDHPLTV